MFCSAPYQVLLSMEKKYLIPMILFSVFIMFKEKFEIISISIGFIFVW